MRELTPERIAADGAAYLDELAKVADQPFAITGYCMGARLGLRIAAAHPERVAALAGFHGGGLATDDPDSPHRSAGALLAEATSATPTRTGATAPSRSPRWTRRSRRGRDAPFRGLRRRRPRLHDVRHPAYDEQAAERRFDALFDLLDRRLGR